MPATYYTGPARATLLRAQDEQTEPLTLDATLRELYASHDELSPCLLSVPELAVRYCPNAKPEHGERAVRRANERIASAYPERFVEVPRTYGRITLTIARWIVKPGGRGRSVVLRDHGIVDLRDLELRAKQPARTHSRTRAPRDARRPDKIAPRRPARRHGVTNPEILAPVALEAGDLAALKLAHGKAATWRIVRELERPRCCAHPVEARRAARTLAVRTTEEPLRLFRHLFGEALGGDMLCDKRAQRDETVRAEAENVLGPECSSVLELEERLAAVRASGGDPERVRELEAAIRVFYGKSPLPPAPRRGDSRPPPRELVELEPMPERRLEPSAGARFLSWLKPSAREFPAGDTS